MRPDPRSILGRLVCLLLAVAMPLCCCTVQVFGDALASDPGVQATARPTCCCSVSSCPTDAEPDDDTPATDGCLCVRTAPILDAPTDQTLARLALPAAIMVAWTDAAPAASVSSDATPIPRSDRPPDEAGPPDASARALRRAVIIQV